MKILVINGPNLNMLGIRQPEIYGSGSYKDLCDTVNKHALSKGVDVEIYQSNFEGEIVEKIQSAYNTADGIIINPAAYTHTSVAILDALLAVKVPAVEVHLSDPERREAFRRINYVRNACIKSVCGKGTDGYKEALDFLTDYIEGKR